MLILTRRIGEVLCVGDEVEVVVLGVKGGQVRIGINAPRDVAVVRKELLKEWQGQPVDQKALRDNAEDMQARQKAEAFYSEREHGHGNKR